MLRPPSGMDGDRSSPGDRPASVTRSAVEPQALRPDIMHSPSDALGYAGIWR